MLTLKITRAEGRLRFVPERENERGPMIFKASEEVPWADVEVTSRKLLPGIASGLRGLAAQEALVATGKELFRLLVPADVVEILRKTHDGEDVWLVIEETLVQYPWELLHDGNEFLCTRFNLSRAVETGQKVAERSGPPELRALIIGNPERNNPERKLDAAEQEVKELEGLLADLQRVADTGPAVTLEFVKEHLPACSLVHFSGHSEYDPAQPKSSGWRLADGRLTCEDIERLAKTQVAFPRLIFSNSCSSAATSAWEDHERHIYGLVHAFLGAGVQCYLGSYTTIHDRSASAFAKTFYQHLLAGATAGEAVRKARQTLRSATPDNPTWASYVLYGDPRFRLANTMGRSTFLEKHQSNVRRQAAESILACKSLGLSPEQFFYGQRALYVGIQVREPGESKGQRLEEIILEKYEDSPTCRRLLLLGEGGAGKSTELLRLFFDCVAEESSSKLRGHFTPCLLRLGLLPQDWRENPKVITLENFLELLREELECQQLSPNRFRRELQWTPRLLILMDGLDEFHPATQEVRDAFGGILEQFVDMCSSAWVVLASRDKEQERGRGLKSLLRSRRFGDWRRLSIEDFAWSESEVKAYLQKVGRSPDEVNALLELLRPHTGLLRNPMLLYLFGAAKLETIEGKPLASALLYRAAMETWLEKELNEKLPKLEFTFPMDPVKAVVKLIGILAKKILERDQNSWKKDEAASRIKDYIIDHPQRPKWWPEIEKNDKKRGYGYGDGDESVNEQELYRLSELLTELCVFVPA